MQCVQGFITFEDTDEDDGTLMVYKKSHLYHQKMFKMNKHSGSDDWYKLTEQDLKWVKNSKLEEVKIKAPKGSLVLWDSRLFIVISLMIKIEKIKIGFVMLFMCA